MPTTTPWSGAAARRPIQLAPLIAMSIERPALERALKPVTADIDKSLGRLALAVRQREVHHAPVIRAALALQPVELSENLVVNGENLTGNLFSFFMRRDHREAHVDHLEAVHRDRLAEIFGARALQEPLVIPKPLFQS